MDNKKKEKKHYKYPVADKYIRLPPWIRRRVDPVIQKTYTEGKKPVHKERSAKGKEALKRAIRYEFDSISGAFVPKKKSKRKRRRKRKKK